MPVSDLSDEEIHRRALKMLLTSRQAKLRPTYRSAVTSCQSSVVSDQLLPAAGCLLPAIRSSDHCSLNTGSPRRPEAITAALPGRFEIVYEGGTALDQGIPIDRIDRDYGT